MDDRELSSSVNDENIASEVSNKKEKETVIEVSEMDTKAIKEKLHVEEDVFQEKKNSSLASLCVGIILTVLGTIFFFLSFKKGVTGARAFRPTSFEFIISIPVLIAGISFIVFGIVLFVKNRARKRRITELSTELKKR